MICPRLRCCDGRAMIAAVSREKPELILAPMRRDRGTGGGLVAPSLSGRASGIKGDRGPSSLDWAIANHERSCGVTILERQTSSMQADIGPRIEFAGKADPPARAASIVVRSPRLPCAAFLKRSLESKSGDVQIRRLAAREAARCGAYVRGCCARQCGRPTVPSIGRGARRPRSRGEIRAADSAPGVLGTLLGESFFHAAHEEERLQGAPGQVLVQARRCDLRRHGGVARLDSHGRPGTRLRLTRRPAASPSAGWAASSANDVVPSSPGSTASDAGLATAASRRARSTQAAKEIGFLDDAFGDDASSFMAELKERARRLAKEPEFRVMLRRKHERRLDDECVKPPRQLSRQELARMWVNFFGSRPRLSRGPPALRLQGNPPPRGSQAPIETAAEAGPWVSRREAAWLAWVSYPFSDRGPRPQIDPDRLGIAMPRRTAANGMETRGGLFPLRVMERRTRGEHISSALTQ